jgi:hypothetical protein
MGRESSVCERVGCADEVASVGSRANGTLPVSRITGCLSVLSGCWWAIGPRWMSLPIWRMKMRYSVSINDVGDDAPNTGCQCRNKVHT